MNDGYIFIHLRRKHHPCGGRQKSGAISRSDHVHFILGLRGRSCLNSFPQKRKRKMLSCIYTCEHVRKIYFSTNFQQTRVKWRTNCTGGYMKIIGKIGKSSREHGREQKFRQTRYSLSREHPLYSSKKPPGDGSQRTVRKSRTNYTNIVFTNKMFTSVYAAFNNHPGLLLRHDDTTMASHKAQVPQEAFKTNLSSVLQHSISYSTPNHFCVRWFPLVSLCVSDIFTQPSTVRLLRIPWTKRLAWRTVFC